MWRKNRGCFGKAHNDFQLSLTFVSYQLSCRKFGAAQLRKQLCIASDSRCLHLECFRRMGGGRLSAHLIAELFLLSVQKPLNVRGNCGKMRMFMSKRCPIQKNSSISCKHSASSIKNEFFYFMKIDRIFPIEVWKIASCVNDLVAVVAIWIIFFKAFSTFLKLLNFYG